jgi:hypothetical protein
MIENLAWFCVIVYVLYCGIITLIMDLKFVYINFLILCTYSNLKYLCTLFLIIYIDQLILNVKDFELLDAFNDIINSGRALAK